jgi:tRNA(adenine34) deaminase
VHGEDRDDAADVAIDHGDGGHGDGEHGEHGEHADITAMRAALAEARAAVDHDDVPVGAVVLRHGEIIAARHNERELSGDPTAHAEVLALRDAAAAVGHWRLDDCTLVVTLEPCTMCAGAMVNGRLGRLVYGAPDPKAGAAGSCYDLVDSPVLNHRIPRTTGVLADECGDLLRQFFRERRRGAVDG